MSSLNLNFERRADKMVPTRMSQVYLLVFMIYGAAATNCPSDTPGLQSFAAQFPTATTTTNLVITTATLLDVTSVDVRTIVISGNGKLIFKPGNDITIRTRMIRVKDNGQLVIGSDECRFEDNVDIALHAHNGTNILAKDSRRLIIHFHADIFGKHCGKGEIDQLICTRNTDRDAAGAYGDKYISVQDNGQLMMFGKDKLAWTKLTSTVNMPAPEYSLQTDSRVEIMAHFEGLTMTVFDQNLDMISYVQFDFFRRSRSREQQQVDRMVEALNAVNNGDVVAIALNQQQKNAEGVDFSVLFSTIETIAGMDEDTLALRTSGDSDAFAMVFKKVSTASRSIQIRGTSSAVSGALFNQRVEERIGKSSTTAWASIEVNRRKISSVSTIDPSARWRSSVNAIVTSASEGYPTLSLAHDVSGTWEIGDSVLIASTDYTWMHNEVRTIKSFPTQNSIQLDHELTYRHFGQIENNVDMRAEVALLSRNIKIHGELSKDCPEENGNCRQYPYDTNGCNIKMLYGFAAVHIEGVELYHCGQTSDKGFYPIHFHMCEDVTDVEAVIKGNSIHDSFQRAVVIHGTYGTSETALGVEVIDNVAYNVLGHAYFEEDGAEKATLFRGNLAASVQKIKNGFIQTDENKPTGFWITTPETVFVGNVVAGAAGYGIWYTFPEKPVGPSKGLGIYRMNEASRTPLYTNDNNVVHSCTMGGMNFDNILENDDGDVAGCMRYNPRVNPLDKNSEISPVSIYRLTAYKNIGFNLWLRGGGFNVQQCSLAESKRGVQLATGGPQHQYLSKCVIVGESENNNESIEGYPDAFGKETNGARDFNHYLGIVFYDGPVWVSDSFFTGFKSKEDGSIVAGALGFQPKNKFSSSIVSTVRNLQFGGNDITEENWVFDGNMEEDEVNGFANFDGDETATFRDADGSVVKCANAGTSGPYQIYKPEKFIQTDRSLYRSNWKMSYSTDMYGKLDIMPFSLDNTNSQMKRVNRLNAADFAYENILGDKSREYTVVLNRTDNYYYQFQYTNGFGDGLRVTGKGVARNENVIVGVCMPEGTTRDDIYVRTNTPPRIAFDNTQSGLIWVDNINTLAQDTTMSRVMLKDRFLYVHLTNRLERDTHWDKYDDDHCPGGECPSITITLQDGAPESYTPCFTPSEADLNTDVSIEATENCVMNRGTNSANWGAGNTLMSRDGSWTEWSSWSECCNTDTSSPVETSRIRTCTAPTPYGDDGQDCQGVSKETKDCEAGCPVDGAWGQWQRWSDCSCMTGTSGVRSRTRNCDGTASGGTYCRGTSDETSGCSGDC